MYAVKLDYKLPKKLKNPQEWGKDYLLKCKSNNNFMHKMSIYEFAYLVGSGKMNYRLVSITDPEYNELSSEKAELNELMLLEVYNAVMKNADDFEKDFLKNKYMETDWVKAQLKIY